MLEQAAILHLGLPKGLLRLAVFGDIALEREHRLDHPLRVPLGHEPPVEDHRPLLSLQRELGLVRRAAVEYTPDGLLPVPGLRFGKAKLAMGLADEFLHREVDHVVDVIGYEQVPSVAVKAHHDVRQPLHHGPVPFLTLPEPLLGLLFPRTLPPHLREHSREVR